MIKWYFTSRRLMDCGIIRMHGHKTCEIPLLSCSDSSVWSSSATMFCLQENMVDPSKETRASDRSNLSQRLKPDLLGRIYSSSSGQTASWRRFVKLSPQISSGVKSVCRSSKSSKAPFRSTGLISRRALVSLPKHALGLVSDCTQALLRQDSRLSGSYAPSRTGRSHKMETSFRSYSSGAAISNSSPHRRQPSRHETYRQAKRVDSSTVSLPFNAQTPDPTRPQKNSPQRRICPGRNLPDGSPSSRHSQRIYPRDLACTIELLDSNLLRHSTHSSCRTRIYPSRKILSSLSDSSGIKPSGHNQHRRIHGLYHPRFTATQPLSIQPSITCAVDHSVDSITSEVNLQWQTSSTDLINSTPKCDLKLGW